MTHHLIASVAIPINEPLDELAGKLSARMPGFVFEEDMSGRYDEFPAFIAENNGSEFVLLGLPLGEPGSEYALDFRCETEVPIAQLLAQDPGGFIGQFVRRKTLNERGFMDFSEELAQVLATAGIPGCRPIQPGL